VLGSSVFDPRGFAAAWASAGGVTSESVAPTPPAPFGSSVTTAALRPPSLVDRFTSKRWPVVAGALAVLTVLAGMLAVGGALVVGRSSSAVAAPVHSIVRLPGSRLIGPGPVTPPARYFLTGPLFAVSHGGGFVPLAAAVLCVGLVGLGLAISVWFLWSRRHRWRGNG
jgi:hypothetical protein